MSDGWLGDRLVTADGSETSSLRTGACSRDRRFEDWHTYGWEVPSSCSGTHARHVGSVRSIDRSASDGHGITHSPCHHAIPTALQLYAHASAVSPRAACAVFTPHTTNTTRTESKRRAEQAKGYERVALRDKSQIMPDKVEKVPSSPRLEGDARRGFASRSTLAGDRSRVSRMVLSVSRASDQLTVIVETVQVL